MSFIRCMNITISTVQMNGKFGGLSQCYSQQNFSLPYYYPLSPLSKIATPHRPRPNHTNSYASPITFLTANHHDKSAQGKENQGASVNLSPMYSISYTELIASIISYQKGIIMAEGLLAT